MNRFLVFCGLAVRDWCGQKCDQLVHAVTFNSYVIIWFAKTPCVNLLDVLLRTCLALFGFDIQVKIT